MSTIHERRLARMASASDVIGASEFKSPLAQVRSLASSLPATNGDPGPSSSLHQQQEQDLQASLSSSAYSPSKAVPTLDFNLFRTNSVYSVSSVNTISSFDTSSAFSSEDDGSGPGYGFHRDRFSFSSTSTDGNDEMTLDIRELGLPRRTGAGTPTQTTPRAEKAQYFDFDLGPPIPASGSAAALASQSGGTDTGPNSYGFIDEAERSGQATPKRSAFARSQPIGALAAPPPPAPTFARQPSASPSRPLAETHRDVFFAPTRNRSRADSAAKEGEVPASLPQRQSTGGADWESLHGEQGSEWGEDEAGYEWLDKGGLPIAQNGKEGEGEDQGTGREHRSILSSPSKGFAKLKMVVSASIGADSHGVGDSSNGSKEGREGRKLKKHVILPRRAAPPPPAAPGLKVPPKPVLEGEMNHLIQQGIQRAASPNALASAAASGSTETLVGMKSKSGLADTAGAHVLHAPSAQSATLAPTMVPLRDTPGSPTRPNPPFQRGSHLSIQSNSFSLYDLDGSSSPSARTPRATTPSGGEMAFPKGTYTKVSASTLAAAEVKPRTQSDPLTPAAPRSPLLDVREASKGDLLERGVWAREKGDLPKAAWYFRQAADAGSVTGRIYWGLALRHGWGVARDERKAFGELRQACDQSMHTGSRDLLTSEPSAALSINQKKVVARDISMGMFEVANCFLDGIGVKKDPEVAVSYLRFAGDLGDLASQEQLGFLLSRGGNGIKKDMKEAAKWYRMAISQGSTTIGLAWVWKEKYMV